jgi:hypothetical protein
MKPLRRIVSLLLLLSVLALCASCREEAKDSSIPQGQTSGGPLRETEISPDPSTREVTDYHAPAADPDDFLTGDVLADKKAPFDPALVDRRPLGDWQVNMSDSVLRLDVPLVLPDSEPALLALNSSYASAVAAAKRSFGEPVLPSVNLIDGKAKQFDDGLYAALDQAYYKGAGPTLLSHIDLVKRIYDKVGPDGVASSYLAAGLELAGVKVETASTADKDRRLREFQANELLSKPISFYTWNATLTDCFRFLRYFQNLLERKDMAVAESLAKVLSEDRVLLSDYKRAIAFYAKLTNPPVNSSVADLIVPPDNPVTISAVSLFPSSTSRETELFLKLFPQGFPPDADLMRALIKQIRSGAVDLKPGPKSGWYDYQVYALETLLLPERGEENQKLLLTKSYKKRMLEAFKALMTKRRETHARQMPVPKAEAAMPRREPVKVGPRLRLEPCPSYYLRAARAYAFLSEFLESTVGEQTLKTLHGLRDGKEQASNLRDELGSQRALFYGLYLLSAEDIGLKPAFLSGESVDRERCEKVASEWLAHAFADPDIARDTRVAVPINYDATRNVTRLWVTLGVRLTRLNAGYARPPRIKLRDGKEDWTVVGPDALLGGWYIIPVDEFAEVEIKGTRALNRKELRDLCDRFKTKEAIIRAIQQ